MRRRAFISLVGGATLAWPLAVRAQQAAQRQRVHRIGLLVTGGRTKFIDAITNTLGELGYVEGKNASIERRFAEGSLDRLPELAAGLVGLGVDVIVTQGTPATLAAKKATTSIPIAFGPLSDPVGVGIVASLARPGGNATGTSLMASDLSAKRLELLREIMPGISRIAILWDSSNPGMALRVRETKIAADQSHVVLHAVGPRNPEELEAAFVELAAQWPQALLVTTEPFTRRHLTRILDFATVQRLPSMFEDVSYVEGGGLMSYGPNVLGIFQRTATYVDRILKGAKPAELPVEQPTKFELVVNLKTAKSIGRVIPESFLLRADRVIE
jgi:putative ABC transport system substrate-binding protein